MFTAALQLETLFEFDRDRRIIATREPHPGMGPAFSIIRSATDAAWAFRADVPDDVAAQLARLACEEGQVSGLRDAPIHADRYLALLRGSVASGPAFTFPESLPAFSDVTVVDDVRFVAGQLSRLAG